MKFCHLIMKIIKFVGTRCHILRLKCTKFDFNWGSAPDHAGGAYSTPHLRGLLLGEGRGEEEEKGEEGERGGEEGNTPMF